MAFTYRNVVLRQLTYAEADGNFGEVERMYDETLDAALIATAAADIYVSTAAGLAATAEGGYFTVPDTSTDELVIYREVAGVATEQIRFGKPFVGGVLTGALNEAPPVTIASAGSIDIGAAASNTVIVSGAATITALGTIAAGAIRYIRATGAFTLTHNATSLILYGSNIVAAVGEGFWFESLGGGNWRLVGRHYAGPLARTDLANTFVNGQIIQANNDAAGEAMGLRLDRLSASPAAGDYLTSIVFSGRNSSAAITDFVDIRPNITNIGAGTEAGQFEILTRLGNVIGFCAVFGAGVQVGGATGGDLGRGTINVASGLYVNNSAVLKQADIFVSTDQTITLAGALTLAHGLGVAPRLWSVVFVCTTAELGYSIGDVVSTGSAQVPAIWPDATNLNVRYSNTALSIAHKTTGVVTAITAANWKARFLALK